MKHWCIFFLMGLFLCVHAQALINPLKDSINSKWESTYKTDGSTDSVIIQKITVQGNKRTKPQIILRELSFHRGDPIAVKDISAELKLSKQQLMNT